MNKLIGTEWSLVDELFGKRNLKVSFHEKYAKCNMVVNTFTCEYKISGDSLVFGYGWETLAASSPDNMVLDDKFKAMLDIIRFFKIDKNVLILFDKNEEPVFVLSPYAEGVPMQANHSSNDIKPRIFIVSEEIGHGFINPKGVAGIVIKS